MMQLFLVLQKHGIRGNRDLECSISRSRDLLDGLQSSIGNSFLWTIKV
jgi:hypothetical protein